MTSQILDGNAVAEKVYETLAIKIQELKKVGINPRLGVVLVGDDPASGIYVSRKRKACEKIGIDSLYRHYPQDVSSETLISNLRQWSDDPSIHGILVQLPLPRHLDRYEVLHAISPKKDVDGFHSLNIGRIAHQKPLLQPCTAMAVQEILKHYKINTDGANVAIINRGIVVGQPLAMMMLRDEEGGNATVTICHDHTRNLKDILIRSDIVVVAVGKRPEFMLRADMIKPGAIVVDVGINRIDGKVLGDVDYEEVSKIASWITPVPGGVGPTTIAMLLQNTVLAAES
jgi:methylenetetrahydrofolate dehydrogenase (NADP+)/methenyltetrahydrofolate cyclohydrolase